MGSADGLLEETCSRISLMHAKSVKLPLPRSGRHPARIIDCSRRTGASMTGIALCFPFLPI